MSYAVDVTGGTDDIYKNNCHGSLDDADDDETMEPASEIPEDSAVNAAITAAGSGCEADVHEVDMVEANADGGNGHSSHDGAICPGVGCIHTSSARRNQSTGSYMYDKVHYCLYCFKPYTKMARHLVSVHGDEAEVAALPPDGVKRRLKLELLLRRGDVHQSHEVLSMKKGQLVLLRCPENDEMDTITYDEFGPCPDSLGFEHKNMWYHIKQCNGISQNR